MKIVICREDLPENPRWKIQRYPYENCWDIDEFFTEASKAGEGSKLFEEARRIYWEAYWRLLGRYKRGRPFFEVYEVYETVNKIRPVYDRERWILSMIIGSAMASDVVPPTAKAQTVKLYSKLFGRPVVRQR